MRTAFFPSILAALISLVWALPAHASDWSIESFKKQAQQSDWEPYDVGTSVTTKSEGVSPMGSRSSVERETIVKIEEKEISIKVEKQGADGTWTEVRTEKVPRKKDVTFKMEEAGEAKIKVGETEYDCKIIKGTKIEDGESEDARFWVHATHGILQMEMPAGPAQTITMTCTKLDIEHKVGDVTFKGCRSFHASMEGGSLDMTIALDSPEQMLVQRMSMEQGGMKMSQNTDVTAVTLKKKAAAVTK
jgi:hypothetical protein